jgi:hypothetical protein
MTPVPLQSIYSFLAPVEPSINGDLKQQKINHQGDRQGHPQTDDKEGPARLLSAGAATRVIEPGFIAEVVVNAVGCMAVMAGAWFAVPLLGALVRIC